MRATLTGTTISQVTGAVFAGLANNAYSITVNQTGYVGRANTRAAATQSVSVAAGVVTPGDLAL